MERDRRRDRGRRPLAPRRARRRAHRGRPARPRAERDARPDRERVRGAHRVRSAAAALRRRRVARAAHAAHVDPRLRRAVPARRGRPARRSRQGDAAHRGRSGRAWACSSTTCCCSRGSTRAGRSNTQPVDLTRITARRGRRPARAVAPDRPIDFAVERRGRRPRRRGTGCARCSPTCSQNARTHTPPDTPVHVRVGGAGDDAVIEVADEGPGMSAEDASRVFERFWRADPSRTRASGGAGLGLAIVAAITDAHGGRAEVQTAPGEGATFRIRIPRRHRAPTPPTPSRHAGADPTARPPIPIAELEARRRRSTLVRRPGRRACRGGRR